MDIKKILALPAAEQTGQLKNAIVDYRCNTDPLMPGETERPWVTATISDIDADQGSLFVEGRWLFRKHVELRQNTGEHLRRTVPKFGFDDRRDGINDTSDALKREVRGKFAPGPVVGAAGPNVFVKA